MTWSAAVLGKRPLLDLLSSCSQALMPQSYRLPRDSERFNWDAARNPTRRWLAKPINVHSARMIRVVNASEAHLLGADGRTLRGRKVLHVAYSIQRMIEPPVLVDGRVVDVGLFVMLSGHEPVRAYALSDWKVRVASAGEFFLET